VTPAKIHSVLDLALRARKKGKVLNPLFVGDAGLGKSSIIQQWCRNNELPFIDLRGAYLEAPDMIGFPSVSEHAGRQITKHNLPEFWPHEGAGVILLEEPNRATTAVMNTFMQLLTDRKIHNYEVPSGWIIVGAINPENENYDVNTMDTALKNRFMTLEVEYDRKSFVEYMKKNKWDLSVIQFVESGTWTYTKPEALANGAKLISPRTMEQLNTVVIAGVEPEDEFMVYESILGKAVGKAFYAFRNNERPVLYKDLKANLKDSIKRLEVFANPKNYKNSQISITISDLIENREDLRNDKDDLIVSQVALVLPVDQGLSLIKELEFQNKDFELLKRLCTKNKDLKKMFKDVITTK
jgi:MoxR-like ATPase